MNSTVIKPETPVTLFVLAACVIAIFAIYEVLVPRFQQIEINKSELKNHKEVMRAMSNSHELYNAHIMQISNSLSRIEGRLDSARISAPSGANRPR